MHIKPRYDTSMHCGPSLKIAWVAKETSLLCLHSALILHPTTRFLNTSVHTTKICGSTNNPPGWWFHFLAHGLTCRQDKYGMCVDPVGIAVCRQARTVIYLRQVSNPQPPACKLVALPTELPGNTAWSTVCSITVKSLATYMCILLHWSLIKNIMQKGNTHDTKNIRTSNQFK